MIVLLMQTSEMKLRVRGNETCTCLMLSGAYAPGFRQESPQLGFEISFSFPLTVWPAHPRQNIAVHK